MVNGEFCLPGFANKQCRLATENNSPSEPSDADQSDIKDRLIQQSKTCFTPLHCNEPNCLLGFRSDAKAIELYDAATLWVVAQTCPSTCIRPDQSFALDLTGMLAEYNHWCRSRQATTGQNRTALQACIEAPIFA